MDLSYLDELSQEDFYESLMDLADNTQYTDIRHDENLVHGCQSKVWLVLDNEQILFDSDSLFVKGLITAVVSQLATIEEMKNVKISDYSFINLNKITYQRIKGIDSFINKLNKLAS